MNFSGSEFWDRTYNSIFMKVIALMFPRTIQVSPFRFYVIVNQTFHTPSIYLFILKLNRPLKTWTGNRKTKSNIYDLYSLPQTALISHSNVNNCGTEEDLCMLLLRMYPLPLSSLYLRSLPYFTQSLLLPELF